MSIWPNFSIDGFWWFGAGALLRARGRLLEGRYSITTCSPERWLSIPRGGESMVDSNDDDGDDDDYEDV